MREVAWDRSPAVGYVLKGFPRRSETFIASEIQRVEATGLPVRIFVIKPRDEDEHHPVVARIRTRPVYLPPATSVSGVPLWRWVRTNLPAFRGPLWRTLRSSPRGLARAAAEAARQSVRARPSRWSWPRKVYTKELFQAAALADELRRAPEVRHLHAHFAHGAATVTWFASIITGLPFSFTGHAKDVYSPALNPAGLLTRKLRAARFAVTCTEASRVHLAGLASDATVLRLHHGLNADMAQLVEGSPTVFRDERRLDVLSVGRLVPKKGLDTLVEACARLVEAGLPVRLRIVGEDGEARPALERQIAGLDLRDHVTLCGPMTQAELYAEYRRATAMCLPCRVADDGDRDGIPNVLVEAMACGLPVVSTTISGIPELIEDGRTGLLVPPDRPAAIVSALESLWRDRELARRLAAEGRRTVLERFDGERLAAELAGRFREAMAA